MFQLIGETVALVGHNRDLRDLAFANHAECEQITPRIHVSNEFLLTFAQQAFNQDDSLNGPRNIVSIVLRAAIVCVNLIGTSFVNKRYIRL
jgi:hypothetical protein